MIRNNGYLNTNCTLNMHIKHVYYACILNMQTWWPNCLIEFQSTTKLKQNVHNSQLRWKVIYAFISSSSSHSIVQEVPSYPSIHCYPHSISNLQSCLLSSTQLYYFYSILLLILNSKYLLKGNTGRRRDVWNRTNYII